MERIQVPSKEELGFQIDHFDKSEKKVSKEIVSILNKNNISPIKQKELLNHISNLMIYKALN